MDWNASGAGKLDYSYAHFALAKSFVFRKWCDLATERGLVLPVDLSGACKYGSLFMHGVFGGSIRGHYQHQYNHIDGRTVDLSHDAADVGAMGQPYLHEPDYFALPSLRSSLDACVPRVNEWVIEFLIEVRAAEGATSSAD